MVHVEKLLYWLEVNLVVIFSFKSVIVAWSEGLSVESFTWFFPLYCWSFLNHNSFRTTPLIWYSWFVCIFVWRISSFPSVFFASLFAHFAICPWSKTTLQMFAGIYRDFAGKSECGDFKFTGIACIPAIPVIF